MLICQRKQQKPICQKEIVDADMSDKITETNMPKNIVDADMPNKITETNMPKKIVDADYAKQNNRDQYAKKNSRC